MKSPITMLSRPQPAGVSVARRLLWGQAPAPQKASKYGGSELTQLSSIFRVSISIRRGLNTARLVVPPLGGSVWRHGMDPRPTLPPKGGTTNFAAGLS